MKLTIELDLARIKKELDEQVADADKTGRPETEESIAEYADDHMDELVDAAEGHLVDLLVEYHSN